MSADPVDVAIRSLRQKRGGERMQFLKSRAGIKKKHAGHLFDVVAPILWIVVTHTDVLKMRQKVKYVLLPASSTIELERLQSRAHIVIYRPSTQRLYEVAYYATCEAGVHWMQVLREHNLERETRVTKAQIPRGQPLIVERVVARSRG